MVANLADAAELEQLVSRHLVIPLIGLLAAVEVDEGGEEREHSQAVLEGQGPVMGSLVKETNGESFQIFQRRKWQLLQCQCLPIQRESVDELTNQSGKAGELAEDGCLCNVVRSLI